MAKAPGSKCKKAGHNNKYCEYYTKLRLHEKHKIKKLNRHISLMPNDKIASKALQKSKMRYDASSYNPLPKVMRKAR